MKNIWSDSAPGTHRRTKDRAPGLSGCLCPRNMARCRTLWTGILVLMTAGLPVQVQSFSHLSFNLCKWCEVSSPVCRDSICFSNCTLSSFCTNIEEICVAVWRKTNDTMTVHTMCHQPALPLEGVDPGLLLNFTSRECHMVPQPADDGVMMVCGCHGEHECNDKLLFNKRANGLPVQVQSFSHLSFNLCKWCEVSSPVCRDSICFSNCTLSSFCTNIEEICVAVWRKTNDTMTVHTMCHQPALPLEGVDPGLLLNFTSRECHMVPQPADDGVMMVCGCHGEHECNDKLLFNKRANGFFKLQSKDVIPVVVVSLVPPVLVAIVATAAFYFYRTHRPDKPGSPAPPDWTTKRTPELYQALDLSCRGVRVEGGGGVMGPGSEKEESNAKGPPLDSDIISDITDWQGQLTGMLPIKLDVLVGKGRFAEVWRARLLQGERGGVNSYETVAVKVFPAVEYASWRNECSIFSDPKLEHDNVVGFLAAEERGPPGHALRKYWLVLAYHSLGNLQDFLTANTLNWEELVAMAGSIAKGLAHLHSDTTPSGVPKVPVAHRDLKSSNIVVKSRKESALCDFGLALRLDLSLTVDDYANSGQVGTARYMAPEVLESRVNLEDLEAFKQMDVYSMALVLWEMASRCHAIGKVEGYEPAFGSKVCEQPCVDSMRDLVLRDRGRPDIPSAWIEHQGMNVFCSTITECWDHDPEARLTAHCVVERFTALQQEEEEEEEEEGLRADAVREEDEERQKNPDSDQILSFSPSSLQLPPPETDDPEVSHDSLVHPGSGV